MKDIIGLGELLIDFTPRGTSEHGSYVFESNPGGAPPNVLAAMQKLGKSTAFIGKIGTDTFGVFLKDTLVKLGIDTEGLVMTDEYFTTLAFVTLDDDGNRSFAFARKASADVMLSADEVNEDQIKNARIFHCGTLSLTHESAKQATIKALECAKANGVCISVDPNLRLALWENEDKAKEAIRLALSYADILKISDYEIEFLYGTTDIKEGIKRLQADFGAKLIFATCGKDGAYMAKGDMVLHHPCFDSVKTVDTTGAGDCFCGTALSKLLDYNLDIDALNEEACMDILRYANAAASLATASYGAIPAMPDDSQIQALINA
ncbi:MAG: carbohydrate kinase [Clostridia bacterium]|nr:carbohydrate kinase [Clostridia bacterium]